MIHPRYITTWSEESLSALNLFIDDVIRTFRTLIFGSGNQKADFEIEDTGEANTPFTVRHKFGCIPEGYIVIFQSKPGSLYVISWNEEEATFAFSNDNAKIKIRLFA